MTRPKVLFPNIPDTPGVYCIRNTVNGRRYIGCTRRLRQRWLGHVTDLQRNDHHNKFLQADWVEHGANAFEFTVLIPGGWKREEAKCITEYRTEDLRFGYNQPKVYRPPYSRPAPPDVIISRLTWLELDNR